MFSLFNSFWINNIIRSHSEAFIRPRNENICDSKNKINIDDDSSAIYLAKTLTDALSWFYIDKKIQIIHRMIKNILDRINEFNIINKYFIHYVKQLIYYEYQFLSGYSEQCEYNLLSLFLEKYISEKLKSNKVIIFKLIQHIFTSTVTYDILMAKMNHRISAFDSIVSCSELKKSVTPQASTFNWKIIVNSGNSKLESITVWLTFRKYYTEIYDDNQYIIGYHTKYSLVNISEDPPDSIVDEVQKFIEKEKVDTCTHPLFHHQYRENVITMRKIANDAVQQEQHDLSLLLNAAGDGKNEKRGSKVTFADKKSEKYQSFTESNDIDYENENSGDENSGDKHSGDENSKLLYDKKEIEN